MSSSTIAIDQGGDVEIRFVLEDADTVTIGSIMIQSAEGDVVFEDEGYSEFNEKGLGIIRLSASEFEPGLYIMTIIDLSRSSPLPTVEYHFRAE